jgi:tetratricopeptide (TPR) repeat protein
MCKEVMAAQKRVLGPEHPDSHLTAATLAVALLEQGKHAEAVACYKEVLLVKKRALGPEHADTLQTAGNLADALSKQGEHAEAVAMYKKLLPVQKRVVGSEHPDTLRIAANLADAMSKQGKPAEAVAASDAELGLSQPSSRLKEGSAVVICGVVSKPTLNGQHASVLQWNHAKLRYAIKTEDGAKILLKPENIAELD